MDKLATLVAVAFIIVPIACAIWFLSLRLFHPWLNAVCAFLLVVGLYLAEFYLLMKTL